jgi:hypothetical protein
MALTMPGGGRAAADTAEPVVATTLRPPGRPSVGGSARPDDQRLVGFILFAAIMMLMVGIWQALQGLVAIFENEFYVATRNYLFQFDVTTWGWIHLIVGVIVAFAGWGLLSGRIWARVVAITLAVLSAIANSARHVASELGRLFRTTRSH